MVIDSAKGDYFDAFYKKPETNEKQSIEEPATEQQQSPGGKSLLNPLFDGSASWFT